MKALTICQPYAQMILRGEKTCENRTWDTKHRGLTYIHAGKSREWWDDTVHGKKYQHAEFGAVIAIAELVAVIHVESKLLDEWFAKMTAVQQCHVNGPYCWIFGRITPIGPWPYRGAQGLFDIDGEKLGAIANKVLGIEVPR